MGGSEFERHYIPSEVVIKKLVELVGYLSQEDKNKLLRSLDSMLELVNRYFPNKTIASIALLNQFAHESVTKLGLTTPSPAFAHEYMKFLLGYAQLSDEGRKTVLDKVASLIDPDISGVPDSIGEDFKI